MTIFVCDQVFGRDVTFRIHGQPLATIAEENVGSLQQHIFKTMGVIDDHAVFQIALCAYVAECDSPGRMDGKSGKFVRIELSIRNSHR